MNIQAHLPPRSEQANKRSVVPKNQAVPKNQKSPESKPAKKISGSKEPKTVAQEQVVTPFKRFWIKVYMRTKYADIQPILNRWKSKKTQSQNLAAAIKLYDALERGDLDAAEEIAPSLKKIWGNQKRSKMYPPIRDSESIDQLDQEGVEIAEAISEVTLFEFVLHQRAITKLTVLLRQAGYTPADVRDWYKGYWLQLDWRGKKGERPALKDVRDLIGRSRDLPTPSAELLATEPDQFPSTSGLSSDESIEEVLPRRPKLTSGNGATWWMAVLGQLKVELNRATYDTWVNRLWLVETRRRNDTLIFVATVPTVYAKDWLERHLVQNMATFLERLCESKVEIEIEIDNGS